MALLGGVAGFIDVTSGGGWGPVATPTLLATGKIEPRKVIGSVSAAEFAVAAAASSGFAVGLGMTGVSISTVAALLVGGAIAAPMAAMVVRRVVPAVLGVGVGGLIVLTNTRTLLLHFELPRSGWMLGILAALWLYSVARTARKARSESVPPGGPGDVVVLRKAI